MNSLSLIVPEQEKSELKQQSQSLKSWDLSARQVCDVELLLTGGFAPLTGYMTETEVVSVMKSEDWHGHYWPAPIMLDVTEEFSSILEQGESIALRDQEGVLVALMDVSSVFKLSDVESSDQSKIQNNQDLNPIAIGGALRGLEVPTHHDFTWLRSTSEELSSRFRESNYSKVVGYATRRPLHQREVNQINHVLNQGGERENKNVLIAPATGMVKPEDTYHYAKVDAYEAALDQFSNQEVDLCLIPLYSRGDPVVDVILHAIILRNSGCTDVMLDDQYFSGAMEKEQSGEDESSVPSEELKEKLQSSLEKLNFNLVIAPSMVFSTEKGHWVQESSLKKGEKSEILYDVRFEKLIDEGLDIPAWFSYPEVIDKLKKVYRPRAEQGLTIFFTGLSGAGKSTVANAVLVKLMETGERPITLLDGDIVRQHLSSELGFSKEHRDLNIRRIGYVASEITKHGGIAICAPIAPYRDTRRLVRQMIEEVGGFVEVYVATSIEECERRDRKGLYAKARAGIIKEFTGISDPYEEPEIPELRLDTEGISLEEGAQKVLSTLEKLGYIGTE